MNDPKSRPPVGRPAMAPPNAKAPSRPTPAPAARPSSHAPAARTGGDGATGKVVHDDRGNAVWDWLAQTSRIAIDATSRLLKKLEMPELKVEDAKDEELRVAPEPSTGAGYDPYNQATKPSRGRK